jgi:hypothetical protein
MSLVYNVEDTFNVGLRVKRGVERGVANGGRELTMSKYVWSGRQLGSN